MTLKELLDQIKLALDLGTIKETDLVLSMRGNGESMIPLRGILTRYSKWWVDRQVNNNSSSDYGDIYSQI